MEDEPKKQIDTPEPRPYEPGGNPASIIKAEGVTPKDIDEHVVEVSRGMVEQSSAANDEGQEPGPEELPIGEELNITAASIADAIKDDVPPEHVHKIEGMEEVDEALGAAFTALLENGIPDPEQYLIEKGILE